MAKKRKSPAKRDNSSIANEPLASLLRPVLPAPRLTYRFSNLLDLEDHRRFTPHQDTRLFSKRITGGAVSRHVTKAPPKAAPARSALAAHMYHEVPNNVVVCVRRKRRREVLHALRQVRSGRGRSKRRNWRSDIRC